MTLPSLPAQGSTNWYPWAQGVHDAAAAVPEKADASSLAAKADLVDGAVPDAQLPARLSDVELRAALVPFWAAGETVTAGAIRMAPDGTTIERNADGTTGATYDATEQAAWTAKGGGSVSSANITDATTVGKAVLTAADAPTARTAIGAQPAGSYATGAQGALADTAVQPGDLATVATTGAYADLSGKPTIPAAYTDEQAQDAVGAAIAAGTQSGISVTYDDTAGALNFAATGTTSPDATTSSKGIVQLAGDLSGTAAAPTVPGLAAKADSADLATVATSGAYVDLSGKPAIPAAYTDEQVRDVIGAALVAGANVTITPDDAGDTITISAAGGSGSPADATTSSKGVVQLAGDLGGTAAAPTVPTKVDRDSTGLGAAFDTGARAWTTRTRTAVSAFAVPYARAASTATAFDVMPGTGATEINGEGIAWFDVCDIDCADNDPAVSVARVGIKSDRVEFGSKAYAGTDPVQAMPAAKPVYLLVGGSDVVRLRTDGATELRDVGSAPTSNPTGGSLIYSLAGVPYLRTASGTVINLSTLAPANIPQTSRTGTTYTFVLADANTVVEGSNAAAQTLTIPPNSSAAFPVGASITVRQMGAGQITVAPGAGVTLRSRGGALKTAGQYAELTATKRATDEWVIVGDVTT